MLALLKKLSPSLLSNVMMIFTMLRLMRVAKPSANADDSEAIESIGYKNKVDKLEVYLLAITNKILNTTEEIFLKQRFLKPVVQV